jgi:hypothetical protein
MAENLRIKSRKRVIRKQAPIAPQSGVMGTLKAVRPNMEGDPETRTEAIRQDVDATVAALKKTKSLNELRQMASGDKSMEIAMDARYYLVVVFTTTQQRAQFIEAVPEFKQDNEIYIDGLELAKKFGVTLPIIDKKTLERALIEGKPHDNRAKLPIIK